MINEPGQPQPHQPTEVVHQGRIVRYREQRQLLDDRTQLYRNLVPMPDGSELEIVRSIHKRR